MTVSRVARLASVVFCGVLPAVTLVALFASAIRDDVVAFDFRPFYAAAGAVLHGETPYPPPHDRLIASSGAYVYPPLPALGAIPLRVLPLEAAGLVVMVALAVAALAIPFVLGVRDWRCYGIVFLWPPVLSAIQTGNVTLLLGLCAALAWRLRDRAAGSAYVGVTLALKFVLWPLVVWLAVAHRLRTAVLACAVGAGLLVASWAVIGFDGLSGYPDLLRRLEAVVGDDAYTASALALDAGASEPAARAIWLALGLSVLAVMMIVARRGSEREAFVLAIAAALALAPLVWLHYFALLVVVVAVAQPRLGVVWFLPLGMLLSPGSGDPTPFQTTATLAVAAMTIGLALREMRVPARDAVEIQAVARARAGAA